MTLFQGVTLNIEPGVVIKFEDGVRFDVRGTINAAGTVNDSIVFTSASSNPYRGIWSEITLHPDLDASLNFTYCRISYAQNGIEVLYDSDPYPTSYLKHCLFTQNYFAIDGYTGDEIEMDIDSSGFISNESGTGNYNVNYSTKFNHCIFQNNVYGLNTTEFCTVSNCTFCGNVRGIYRCLEHLTNCVFVNNGVGLLEDADNVEVELINCIVTENDTGIVLPANLSYITDSIYNTKICNNHVYNIVNSGVYSTNLPNICWCETDSSAIAASIYDGYDNVSLGLVHFTPFDTCSIDVTGCSASVGIQDPLSDKPSANFPNPFTSSTIIQFNLTTPSQTSLQIFDVNGTEIKTLLENKTLNAGTHSVNFDADHNPAGIYYYVLHCNEKVEVGKMVLVK